MRRIQYDYNAAGQLVRKRVNGAAAIYFLWDRGQLVAELSGSFGRIAEYAYYPGADQPIAVMHGTTTVTSTEYYQLDAQGNVWGTVSESGVVTNIVRLEPWGFGVAGAQPGDGFRLAWKGLMYEQDSTQLYYMRARWYDPRTKRFMTEDPIGLAGGKNPYVFAGNDPVSGRDPSGLRMLCSLWEFCHWDYLGLGEANPSGGGGGGDVCEGWLVVVDGRPMGCVDESAVSSSQIPVIYIGRDSTWEEEGISPIRFHDDGGVLKDAGTWVVWYRTTLHSFEGVPIPGGLGIYTGLWYPDNPRRYDPSGIQLSWEATSRIWYMYGVGSFFTWPTRPRP